MTASSGNVLIPVTGCVPVQNPVFETRVLDLVNQERTKSGAPGLVVQEKLAAAALAHSTDMACRGFFSHNNPDGKTAFDRIQALGYQFLNAGENIYGGDGALNSPEMALQTWLNSPSHKKAMLNPEYTEAGMGVVYLQDSQLGAYYTIVFGHPNN